MEPPEMVGPKLCVCGYTYLKFKVPIQKKSVYWECEFLRSGACDARATTDETSFGLKLIRGPLQQPHNHPPNVDAAEAERMRQSLKRKAAEEPDTPFKNHPRWTPVYSKKIQISFILFD